MNHRLVPLLWLCFTTVLFSLHAQIQIVEGCRAPVKMRYSDEWRKLFQSIHSYYVPKIRLNHIFRGY